jgi:hypothetical protein
MSKTVPSIIDDAWSLLAKRKDIEDLFLFQLLSEEEEHMYRDLLLCNPEINA